MINTPIHHEFKTALLQCWTSLVLIHKEEIKAFLSTLYILHVIVSGKGATDLKREAESWEKKKRKRKKLRESTKLIQFISQILLYIYMVIINIPYKLFITIFVIRIFFIIRKALTLMMWKKLLFF